MEGASQSQHSGLQVMLRVSPHAGGGKGLQSVLVGLGTWESRLIGGRLDLPVVPALPCDFFRFCPEEGNRWALVP